MESFSCHLLYIFLQDKVNQDVVAKVMVSFMAVLSYCNLLQLLYLYTEYSHKQVVWLKITDHDTGRCSARYGESKYDPVRHT